MYQNQQNPITTQDLFIDQLVKGTKSGRWSLHELSVSIMDQSWDKILETDMRCNETSL